MLNSTVGTEKGTTTQLNASAVNEHGTDTLYASSFETDAPNASSPDWGRTDTSYVSVDW